MQKQFLCVWRSCCDPLKTGNKKFMMEKNWETDISRHNGDHLRALFVPFGTIAVCEIPRGFRGDLRMLRDGSLTSARAIGLISDCVPILCTIWWREMAPRRSLCARNRYSNHSCTIILAQSLLHNRFCTIIRAQSFLHNHSCTMHNHSCTIIPVQSFFHMQSCTFLFNVWINDILNIVSCHNK